MELKELGLQKLKLNINDDIIETIFAKEGDHKSRGLDVQVLKNNVVTDTAGIEVDFYAKPRDGKTYMVRAIEIDIKRGKYEIIYPSVILQPGKVESEIVLTKGEQVISTKKFDLLVEDTIATDDIVEKSDERPLLAILVEAAKNEKSRIEAENKRVVAESKRVEIENQREKNESQRKSAESQRQKNEEERKSNEVQRQSNESTRQSQENKRNEAENTRKSSEESRKAVENTRQSNESKRVAAENERVKNEDARKTNENTRIANEKKREENRKIVEGWIANPSQFNGKDLEFHWNGTKLGVRLKGDTEYQYVDLKGQKGDPGDIENLTAEQVISALNYQPASEKEFVYLKNDVRMIDEDITDILGNVSNNNMAISNHIKNNDVHVTSAEKAQIQTNKNNINNNKSDLNLLEFEFLAHENGPYHVVESGHNSNGYYLKFADGTMMCWIDDFRLSTLGISDYYITDVWTFPHKFIEPPSAFPVGSGHYTTATFASLIVGYGTTTETTVRVHAWHRDNSKITETDRTKGVNILAIGRWK